MNPLQRVELYIGQLLTRLGFGMRAKLIILFVIIKVIPLVMLTFIAWGQFQFLAGEVNRRTEELRNRANEALTEMGEVAVEDSVSALNASAIIRLERISTDMAKSVADFLYQRDSDILYAAGLEPGAAAYRHFLNFKKRPLIKQREWVLAPDGNSWVPKDPLTLGAFSPSGNSENNTNYRNRPQELWETEERPLYLEMTYVDLAGNEIVKVTTSDQMDSRRKNVSSRLNTYVKAETYFAELKKLKPGEIYVSDVIGGYVRSRLIGMYTPVNAAARGLEFSPETEAYAGMENPKGRRFKGIVRWAAPAVSNGRVTGYVTLALDHDHIMEFVDRITPMEERYVEMPSAYEGNYAFIWDYQCRSIAHPRHHSIVGFNPDTGEPEVPWLEDRIYNEWQASALPYAEFIKGVPVFQQQSRNKKPAPELTAAGLVGLDGRYLNNAPQCAGWMDLTKEGGSGSFLILWSGIWKPNTAATIPYYTGNYGKTKRGFGFIAIGAGLEDFQRPARETEQVLENITYRANQDLGAAVAETNKLISSSLLSTTEKLGISAGIMIIMVVLIAIWVASVFSTSITSLITGISRFRTGERHFRFHAEVKDEIGTLADSFDEMADSLVEADRGPLVIINMDLRVMYINEVGIATIGKKMEEMLGRPYSEISFYPANSEYDPIAALHEGRETEVLYQPELRCHFKGEASYLTGKDGRKIGYIITSTDVTEIMEQQEKLEQAVLEANLANEHKGNFLARMSHEIRTPMNAIIGMTGIVKKKLSAESYNLEEVLANIGQIETSSQHLLSLLNDILDISKIEAGKIELAREEMDLRKLAQTVASIIEPRCNEKNITFETCFDIPPDRSYQGDALRLRQVLINLLGNAVKFTPECGNISFNIVLKERADGKARIDFSVRDNGIGISENAIASLFTPFQQADSQISQKYGGTGLGLAISRSIVQLAGGDITVTSVLGEGSEFSFSLLLPESEAKESEDMHIEDVADRLQGKRALLVDDVAINRIIAANLLETTGIEIDEAGDGGAAVKIFSESPENTYDIIYMDVQMPVMNGYDAAMAIRALDRRDAKTVPIVALTANAFKEDIDKAIASGMNSHLAKPMDPDRVMEITFKLLEMQVSKFRE
jgi:signal transduction histidine kinase/AmiR/NasT family two-component response regulator/HAMP domain-containing protein